LVHRKFVAASICRSYGALICFCLFYYKHFAPNGADGRLPKQANTLCDAFRHTDEPSTPTPES
jgi:hypothetical protein